jgi:hypothetical protein
MLAGPLACRWRRCAAPKPWHDRQAGYGRALASYWGLCVVRTDRWGAAAPGRDAAQASGFTAHAQHRTAPRRRPSFPSMARALTAPALPQRCEYLADGVRAGRMDKGAAARQVEAARKQSSLHGEQIASEPHRMSVLGSPSLRRHLDLHRNGCKATLINWL